MSRRASAAPNDATGALNQFGSLARQASRNATSRGQRGQSREGSTADMRGGSVLVEVFVGRTPRGAARRWSALQELRGVRCVALARLPRFAWRPVGALARVATDLALQLDDVEEDVGLPT